jgi:hypothetical protein
VNIRYSNNDYYLLEYFLTAFHKRHRKDVVGSEIVYSELIHNHLGCPGQILVSVVLGGIL